MTPWGGYLAIAGILVFLIGALVLNDGFHIGRLILVEQFREWTQRIHRVIKHLHPS